MENMNSQWGYELEMKGDEDDVLARSPKLDDIFGSWHEPMNMLGKGFKKIYPQGVYFGSRKRRKRWRKTQDLTLTWVENGRSKC